LRYFFHAFGCSKRWGRVSFIKCLFHEKKLGVQMMDCLPCIAECPSRGYALAWAQVESALCPVCKRRLAKRRKKLIFVMVMLLNLEGLNFAWSSAS
jgi:hypothetical protein